MTPRREKLRRLATERFDLLVVGGGINGAGIAREAALRGLKTALVDKGDFASGTSSRSSKLIHGGVRYLETGDLALVLEASRERDLLRRSLAPHLVQPLRFFFPVYDRSPVQLWKLRAGLLAYDLLAAFRNIARHRVVGRSRVAEVEPELLTDGLRGGALYFDCFTDDARLVLENVLAAESAGAVCLNYVSVGGFRRENGAIAAVTLGDCDTGEGSFAVPALAVVNATGPWLDHVRSLDDPSCRPVLRPTKGAHIVLPRYRVGNQNAVVLHAIRDRRVMFAIPWEEHTIVGTTDTDFEGSPDRVVPDDDDVAYLLETANHYFPRARLRERDIVSAFAGLRPLIAGGEGEAPSQVSREEEIFESASGLVSLGGGKLTTYRRVAIKVVNRVAERLARIDGRKVPRDSGTVRAPLPGAAPAPIDQDDATAFLARRYGSRAAEVLAALSRDPALGRPLAADGEDLRVEARFAAQDEMARRVEDVLRRRTHVTLRNRDQGASAATDTASLMAGPLGWDAGTERRRAAEYLDTIGTSVEPATEAKA